MPNAAMKSDSPGTLKLGPRNLDTYERPSFNGLHARTTGFKWARNQSTVAASFASRRHLLNHLGHYLSRSCRGKKLLFCAELAHQVHWI
jgi:hypothetical protein